MSLLLKYFIQLHTSWFFLLYHAFIPNTVDKNKIKFFSVKCKAIKMICRELSNLLV